MTDTSKADKQDQEFYDSNALTVQELRDQTAQRISQLREGIFKALKNQDVDSVLGNLLSIDIRVLPSPIDSKRTVNFDGPSSTGTSFSSTIASRSTIRCGRSASTISQTFVGVSPSGPVRWYSTFPPVRMSNAVALTEYPGAPHQRSN